jgi:excisionase family DNA binding protein
VPAFRIKEAADLVRVSDDTLRRWADGGRIETTTDASGRLAVDGVELARLAQELAESSDHGEGRAVVGHSMRDRFSGLVSRVVRDTVMAQVEIQAGPHGSYRCSAARLPTNSAWNRECLRSPRSRRPTCPSRSPRSADLRHQDST